MSGDLPYGMTQAQFDRETDAYLGPTELECDWCGEPTVPPYGGLHPQVLFLCPRCEEELEDMIYAEEDGAW